MPIDSSLIGKSSPPQTFEITREAVQHFMEEQKSQPYTVATLYNTPLPPFQPPFVCVYPAWN